MGPRWKEVIKLLPNRTENMIKNRFYSYLKKKYFPKNNSSIDIEYKKVQDINNYKT